jgi:hypothetical protein
LRVCRFVQEEECDVAGCLDTAFETKISSAMSDFWPLVQIFQAKVGAQVTIFVIFSPSLRIIFRLISGIK